MSRLPYATAAATGAMIRAGDAKAVSFIARELSRLDGNVSALAASLGVARRVLYAWRDSSPALAKAFQERAQGRAEAGRKSPGRPKKRLQKK